MDLIIYALAPIFILLFYVYLRDKYDREPIWLLVKGLIAGVLIVFPVIFVGGYIEGSTPFFPDTLEQAAWTAYLTAALNEEAFKFLALGVIFWRAKAFNERFDGIVYAVFVSLGFAAFENILYVTRGGAEVALLRAFTAVPGHAAFGIVMGYYFGRARLEGTDTAKNLGLSILMPVLFHGTYDFLLMANRTIFFILFIPFLFWLFRRALRRMKYLSDNSVLRRDRD